MGILRGRFIAFGTILAVVTIGLAGTLLSGGHSYSSRAVVAAVPTGPNSWFGDQGTALLLTRYAAYGQSERTLDLALRSASIDQPASKFAVTVVAPPSSVLLLVSVTTSLQADVGPLTNALAEEIVRFIRTDHIIGADLISSASLPSTKSRTVVGLELLATIVVGTFLATIIVLLLERVNPRLREIGQVDEIVGASNPVLVLPRFASRRAVDRNRTISRLHYIGGLIRNTVGEAPPIVAFVVLDNEGTQALSRVVSELAREFRELSMPVEIVGFNSPSYKQNVRNAKVPDVRGPTDADRAILIDCGGWIDGEFYGEALKAATSTVLLLRQGENLATVRRVIQQIETFASSLVVVGYGFEYGSDGR